MKKITLITEELQGLIEGRSVEIIEGFFIKLEDNLENRQTKDIIERYDNEDYWMEPRHYGDDFEPSDPLNDETEE